MLAASTAKQDWSLGRLAQECAIIGVIQRTQQQSYNCNPNGLCGVVRNSCCTQAVDQIEKNRTGEKQVELALTYVTHSGEVHEFFTRRRRCLWRKSGLCGRRCRREGLLCRHLCFTYTRIISNMFESCKVELLETFGDDLTVVNAARVSLGKHVTEFTERDGKLIKYLADHDHTSPFFHPQARFRLKMPIWMAREWFRHTIGFARNEVSRRYVDEPPTFHLPEALRSRAPNKKQGSQDDVHPHSPLYMLRMKNKCEDACSVYQELLDVGICPEQARMVLPQNMMTEFIETGSIAAYARLCKLRMGEDAQLEIREVARMVSDQLEKQFPVSWSTLMSA